ncbi:Uncharacterised protein [Porphyromonas macacae]|uniref:Uncharacterized protein n=1 Tax=Porphyromonas macacae TaxID=28115 RepID=A0A379DKH2_9PORP|nr:Uncharacterised protein [Porphyromonas macacae]
MINTYISGCSFYISTCHHLTVYSLFTFITFFVVIIYKYFLILNCIWFRRSFFWLKHRLPIALGMFKQTVKVYIIHQHNTH